MLFLWQTTDLGKIWLDGDGIKASLSKRLPKEFYLRDLSFVGNSGLLNLYIAVSEDAVSASKRAVESRISTLFAGSGITVSVNWMYIAPKDNRKVTPLWRLPPRPVLRRFSIWGSAGSFGRSLPRSPHTASAGLPSRKRDKNRLIPL